MDLYGAGGEDCCDEYSPVKIMESGVVAVAARLSYTCAIKKDGSLWCGGR
jgi:hypothetical protein